MSGWRFRRWLRREVRRHPDNARAVGMAAFLETVEALDVIVGVIRTVDREPEVRYDDLHPAWQVVLDAMVG